MRLIYVCDSCKKMIGEIDLGFIDENRLGFNVLTPEEKEELLFFDWERRLGTVKAICDECWLKSGCGQNPAGSGGVVH